MLKDESLIEIDTSDIQEAFNGQSVVLKDLEDYVNGKVNAKNKPKDRKVRSETPNQPIPNLNGQFYVSQVEYIEYIIAKREAKKRRLRRKSIGSRLFGAIVWVFQTVLGFALVITIFWLFYLACWYLQQTHTHIHF